LESLLTQTIHTFVLICERKSRNYDFIHEKEYKISLEIIFLDRERVTHFPNYPLKNMNIHLVFDTAYDYAQSIANIAHGLKNFLKISKLFLEDNKGGGC